MKCVYKTDGRFWFKESDLQRLEKYVGEEVILDIKKPDDPKTLAQLAYYRGPVLGAIKEYLDETQGIKHPKTLIHEYNKQHILKMNTRYEKMLDKLVQVPEKKTSFADLTMSEMQEAITKIDAYWTEIGVEIPQVDEG